MDYTDDTLMPENSDLPVEPNENEFQEEYKAVQLQGLYQSWFLDYASYVILERAVPDVFDGLKPVQRRIMHSMKELDDGRYNKVANIVGHTMKYHPHGDASIGDAMVQLGQKELLIDTQGNWGNILTGDGAAAPRYIEARLTKFAVDVLFNPKITVWKSSYDGRNKEPVNLPVKFPLLLAQGVEGIAVGLASKILPHNFNELIEGAIHILMDEPFTLYPDFQTGGLADISKYNDGLRGGKVRVRARITQRDKKTLVITEIPFGTTTTSLIDSVIAASEKGKIKIKKIDDNTAAHVEIVIYLNNGVSPDQTIDALYAFTQCEMSISPNSCVVHKGRPLFLGMSDILRRSVVNTKNLLKLELEVRQRELQELILFSSLEKIFIENRIYREIEECTTWEAVLDTIDKGLEPFKPSFYREITQDDLIRLTEIKIKRISKFNGFKADEIMRGYEEELEKVLYNLANLVAFTIQWFKFIGKKYGDKYPRQTELRSFESIEATAVVAVNSKLYVDREEGFAGTGLKKAEFVCDCSDIDDIIVFHDNGTFMVTKVADKVFVGKDILHIAVFKKNDDRTVYNMVYRDGRNGLSYVKRFKVKSITRDREYDLTMEKPGTAITYFTANPNGEAEVLKVHLRPKPKLKKVSFEYDFSELMIKGRQSRGNLISRHQVRKIVKKEDGVSTLGAIEVFYDDTVKRINNEGRGVLLGSFRGDDKILTITSSGHYVLTGFDITTHFDEEMIHIEKYDSRKIMTVIYYFGEKKYYYLKRFYIEDTDRKTTMVPDDDGSRFHSFSLDRLPQVQIVFDEKGNGRFIENELVRPADFIDVKGLKAKGKRLTTYKVDDFQWLQPIPVPYDPIDDVEQENEKADEVANNDDDDDDEKLQMDLF